MFTVLKKSAAKLFNQSYKKLNPKTTGVGQFDPPTPSPPPDCAFSKNVSSKERLKPWFVLTFNIIISHIFPENTLKFLKRFRRYEEILCQY